MKKNTNLLANRREITLAHVDNILTFNPDFARVRPHQTDEMLEQNAFAAAAAPNNGERLAPRDVEIDTAQNFLRANCFHQALHGNHRPVLSVWHVH